MSNDRLVVVLGPHRSGTTSCVDELLRLDPDATALRATDVVRSVRGTAGVRLLNAQLSDGTIQDRGVDQTRLDASSPEEYGWVICSQHRFPRFFVGRKPDLMRQLLQTEALADKRSIVLKNPWDTRVSSARSVLTVRPQARFVLVWRDVDSVIESQVDGWVRYMTLPQPYLRLIMNPVHFRRTIGWARSAWSISPSIARWLLEFGCTMNVLVAALSVRRLANNSAIPVDPVVRGSNGRTVRGPARGLHLIRALARVVGRSTDSAMATRMHEVA